MADVPAETSVTETGSLSDHEQAYAENPSPVPASARPDPSEEAVEGDGSESEDGERDAQTGRFKGRHRAESQKAGPDDATAIAQYTKRLREAEKDAGFVQQPGESNRVFELRKRAEIAEAIRELKKPKAAVQAAPARPAPTRQSQPTAFAEAEPTLEQFADKEDPYLAYTRALAAYDRRKDEFERRQAWDKGRAEHEQKQHDTQFNTWLEARDKEHVARLETYVKENPGALAKIEAMANESITPAMFAAIHLHEQGPRLIEVLHDHKELFDELFLLTEGKPISDPLTNPLVAIVQRRLLARVPAVSTGAAASPRAPNVAPRPPTPVRTAPQTPSDALPGDTSSLADHESAFSQRSGRRR